MITALVQSIDMELAIEKPGTKMNTALAGPDLSVWRPWAGSLLKASTHPQML